MRQKLNTFLYHYISSGMLAFTTLALIPLLHFWALAWLPIVAAVVFLVDRPK